MGIIGRDKEKLVLQDLYSSRQSEFLVVYGRRRVGKTFLVREYFENRFTFQFSGMANGTLVQQLINFHSALERSFDQEGAIPLPTSWLTAFQQLVKLLEAKGKGKQVLFFDELPWLDTPRSGFIQAFEHFWNSWASARKNILLIACGSAASWMLNKLINSKGGLHNRVTYKMKLNPFTLHEAEQFYQWKGIVWNRYQLIENYMVMGGIPFYMNAVKKGWSAAQATQELFFSDSALFKDEFNNLYASLYRQPANYLAIVETLSKVGKGISRDNLLAKAKVPNGGGASKVLSELELSGFIRKYVPFGKQTKDALYQLVDFYSLFYLKFIKGKASLDEQYWLNLYDTPMHRAWLGIAFEHIVMHHLFQIKMALGITGVQSQAGVWYSKKENQGAQVDLLIARKDQIINLFEIKFSLHEYIIDKAYANQLRNKLAVFKSETKTRNALHLGMITSYGIKKNAYADELLQHSITMDSLFASALS